MTQTFSYILQSTFILSIFYSIYYILLRPEKCFTFNRFYLLLAPILAFSMPLIHIDMAQNNPIYIGSVVLNEVNILNKSLQNSTKYWNWWSFIQGTYLLFVLFFLIKSLLKIFKIRFLKTSGQLEKHQGFNLIRTKHNENVFTFFKNIFIPEDQEIVGEIIAHEKVHAKELHSIDILFCEFLTVVFWFNPIIYLLKSAVEINHEFLADNRVSWQNNSYVNTLANYHIKTMGFSLGSPFSRPSILERIKMIKNQKNKTMKIKFFIPVLALSVLFTIFCCEGQNGDHSPSKINSESTFGLESIYDQVDNHPMPEGGMTTYYDWIKQNIKYPEIARKEGIEGKVFVQFIIDKDGNFRETSIIKGASPSLDNEALRVVSNSTACLRVSMKDKQ